jgi:hypothetical protein
MATHVLNSASKWRDEQIRALTPSDLELPNSVYESALQYLFDRPVPKDRNGKQWYWDINEPEFEADDLCWVKLQTFIFARCGVDLKRFNDQQVGMGLAFLVNNSISDIPHAVDSRSVSLQDEAALLRALPLVWTDCFAPRFAQRTNDVSDYDYLEHICYMWFDVWPSFWNHRSIPIWQEGVWRTLKTALGLPCVNCQRSALHGIGHEQRYLGKDDEVDQVIDVYIASLSVQDNELADYARAAKSGCVQ